MIAVGQVETVLAVAQRLEPERLVQMMLEPSVRRPERTGQQQTRPIKIVQPARIKSG